MGKQRSLLGFIVILSIAAVVTLVQIPIQLGLDLRGGSQLTVQVKTTVEVPEITPRELEGVRRVIEGRMNGLGVSEPLIQTTGQDQVLVQLPGVNDPTQAERVLGGTAQLEFRSQERGTEAQFAEAFQSRRDLQLLRDRLQQGGDEADLEENQTNLATVQEELAALFNRTGLTGEFLQDAATQPVGTSNNWEVLIRFNAQGGERFAELTKSLAGTGRTLGIFLDDTLIGAPLVGVEFAETGITGGNAVITGNFTAEDASDLAIQLRGGALPVPVEVVENRTVGATLGRDSIRRSLYAALGGLVLVLIFMALYYRLPGLIADGALVVYALLTLAAFALLSVTLTLPGIAGFILSIGMAVDANVLIFERTREEIRAGKTLYRAIEAGFHRAFTSILDSNVTTLIACMALFWLGSGFVRGFALTLGLGIVVSMFTAVTCSRSLLLTIISIPGLRRPELFCPKLGKLRQS